MIQILWSKLTNGFRFTASLCKLWLVVKKVTLCLLVLRLIYKNVMQLRTYLLKIIVEKAENCSGDISINGNRNGLVRVSKKCALFSTFVLLCQWSSFKQSEMKMNIQFLKRNGATSINVSTILDCKIKKSLIQHLYYQYIVLGDLCGSFFILPIPCIQQSPKTS